MATALDLDPVSVAANRDFSMVCFHAGQHDRALDAGKRTVELDPLAMYAHLDLGAAYLGKSMYEEALAEIQREREVSKGSHAWPELFSAYIYVQTGQPQKAQKERDKVLESSQRQYVSPFLLACLHFVLGQNDEGFQWVNRAYEEHDPWLCYVRISPPLDRVRSDPRYTDLLRKMSLDS
jgi:tetratricopeptide (TPR) repeat protein